MQRDAQISMAFLSKNECWRAPKILREFSYRKIDIQMSFYCRTRADI